MRINASLSVVTALAHCGKRRAVGRARYAQRYANLKTTHIGAREAIRVSWVGVAVLACVVGVFAGDPPPAPETGTISIRKVDPPEGTTLRRGSSLSMSVEVDYDLKAADSGAVHLSVQCPSKERLVVGKQASVEVLRGAGKASLRSEVHIPKQSVKEVTLWVALEAHGVWNTSTAARVVYKVTR